MTFFRFCFKCYIQRREKPLFLKTSLMTPFVKTPFVLSHASDNIIFRNIEKDGYMGRPITSNLWGPSPSPPKSPPMNPAMASHSFWLFYVIVVNVLSDWNHMGEFS